MMKISGREKGLIAFLLGALVLYLFYQYAYLPQYRQVTALKDKIAQQDREIAKITEFSKTQDIREKEYKILNAKIAALSDNFYTVYHQENIILALNETLKKTGVEGLAIVFGKEEPQNVETPGEKRSDEYPLLGLVQKYEGQEDSAASAPKVNAKDVLIPKMDVTASYQGTYEALMKFIKAIEIFERKILIRDIVMSIGDEGKDLNGHALLQYYTIPKLPGVGLNEEIWNRTELYGKSNPFLDTAGTTRATVQKTTVTSLQDRAISEYDFSMSVKPITADLPTVIVSQVNDPTRQAYLYADNAGVEAVEIEVLKEEDSYYYRFKNQSDSIPKDYSEKVEYVPVGKGASMKVFSNKRLAGEDLSGVNITVYNETGEPFVIYTVNDDPLRPRVKVTKGSGVVQVK